MVAEPNREVNLGCGRIVSPSMIKRFPFLLLLFGMAPALSAATQIVNVGPGLAFNPNDVTIQLGDTVTWNFLESIHTTTSDATTGPETWNSGIVASGGSFSHTFSTVGNHPYYCAVHSFAGGTFMNGVVRVVAAPLAPVLTSVNPTSGTTAGGVSVTLSGSNFAASCTASFGGLAATTSFVSASTLTATTPAHAPGAVNVTVTCPAGSSTLNNAFTFVDPLAVPAASRYVLLLLVVVLATLGWSLLR